MVKYIKLTQDKLTMVSDEDHEWLMQWDWFYSTNGYAKRTEVIDGKRRWIYMHREIMQASRGELVDHINGLRLDNTRANLRIVNRSENMFNRQRNKTHRSSAYKGVSKHRSRFQARIRFYGERIHLGYFESSRHAALMYDGAARYLFGQFARLNFPDEPTPTVMQIRLEGILRKHGLWRGPVSVATE